MTTEVNGNTNVTIKENDRIAQIDPTSWAIEIISHAHHEIHAGNAYQTNITNTNINSAPLRIKVDVPAQENGHGPECEGLQASRCGKQTLWREFCQSQ